MVPVWQTAVFGVLLTMVTVTGAAAQNQGAARRPLELGISASRVLPPVYGDFQTRDLVEPALDLRLTVPWSERFAVESTVMIGRRGDEHIRRIEGLYFISIRQELGSWREGRARPFLTFGVAGYYAHVALAPAVVPQPGGGTFVRPATSYNEFDPPFMTSIGAGVEHRLSSHVAVRAEAQLITVLYLPSGMRVSGGVSVPVGRWPRSPTPP